MYGFSHNRNWLLLIYLFCFADHLCGVKTAYWRRPATFAVEVVMGNVEEADVAVGKAELICVVEETSRVRE
jgi:hypothetical protein